MNNPEGFAFQMNIHRAQRKCALQLVFFCYPEKDYIAVENCQENSELKI